eukprot:6172356-Pleurochrysis_carterae.AAC.1
MCCAAEVRSRMQDLLSEIGLPLDLRTKEEGRQAQDKFYEGSEWQRFCGGGGHSPGGPVIVAQLVLFVADHYQTLQRELAKAAAAHRAAPSSGRGGISSAPFDDFAKPSRKRKGGGIRYAGGNEVSNDDDTNKEMPPWHEAFELAKQKARTEVERCADQVALQAIRDKYHASAERLLSMLLTFDALFAFRKVMRLRYDASSRVEREQYALLFAQSHRMFWEQLERASGGQHKSAYMHAVQLKAVMQMVELGDLWDFSLSALESYHAEVGRVADRTGCRRINADVDGELTVSSAPASKSR